MGCQLTDNHILSQNNSYVMPILSQEVVRAAAASPAVDLPPSTLFDLPERVLQFGTGVLLRGQL